MLKTNPTCRKCGVELNDDNWFPSNQERNWYICKSCHNERVRRWRKANPEKVKVAQTHRDRKRGRHPFNENKECPLYLGVHVAEQVLSHVFKRVKRMPFSNPGFDFICGKGYKIDVKSSCKRRTQSRWKFDIDHNTIADYFLFLAFDNREDLDPLYLWLLPGAKVNHLVSASISSSTIHKWDEYKLDILKVSQCCDAMRS